ncbi:MAG: S8 family peptidase [Ignavibacteria bacterium]|nr:S8 family peptidase [Ignavibacteria bacterium]
MKNYFFKLQFSLVSLIIVSLCLSIFGFSGRGVYTISGNVIKRGPGQMYEVGTINIKFKNSISGYSKTSTGMQNVDKILSEYGVKSVWHTYPLKADVKKRMIGDEELDKIFQIKYTSAADPWDAANKVLNANKDILDWAEPSFVYERDYMPNDPLISGQWHISKINSFQAWDITKGDTNVVVGVVDSGTDLDHPDLQANLRINWADPVNGIDDDANGYVDDWKGWDFWGNDNNVQIAASGNVHGSHVSGCVSQVTDNGVHGAGIGFKTKVMVTKHTDDSNPESLLYNTDYGIVYCYQNGAKVINCSFGSASYSSGSQLVCNNAWANGVVICASAGNGDANGVGQNWARYPASYDNVVSVAATTSTDAKTSFSNYHSTVDVCAPGEGILSTLFPHTYASYDGTSMASPITAGTVALIRAKYPTWTPQQVVDRLKLGVDSIYNLNPSYVGLLGTGRINAFKCVSDLPIVKINSVMHNDSIYGNNDKIYDVNEIIPIAVNFKNTHFAGTNASVRLKTTSPYVQLVQDSVYIGNIPAYGTFATTFANTFKVKALATCPFDYDVTFTVSNSATCYSDNSANTFTIKFRQGYAIHTINNMKLCLTKDGNIGKKAQAYGTGLQIGTGTTNNIYEGGLMVGINNTKVSDCVRRGTTPANVSDTDFVGLTNYTLTTPGIVSGQDGYGKFNDNGAGSNKLGIEVQAYSYAFNTSQDMDYILLKYSIKNTNATALSNAYAGIYIWMAPNGNFSTNNISRLSAANRLAYTYNNSVSNFYLGLGLMTSQTMNFKIVNSTDVMNGFTKQEKWDAMSNNVVNDSVGPGANCLVLTAGPLNIAAGQTETVGFALLKGTDVADLIAKNNIAKLKYQSVGVRNISTEVPTVFSLSQNYPNPFNPVTNIQFALPKDEFVSMKVYDMLGREVNTLVNEFKKAGIYEINMNASSLSSGVYFYRIQAGSYSEIKRMVVLK